MKSQPKAVLSAFFALALLSAVSSAQNSSAQSSYGVLYVGNGITAWPGTDIGAQINAAVAALPSGGGHIHVVAGNYSFSTPILLQGKPVTLECDAGTFGNRPLAAATQLTYTGTGSSIAVTVGGSNLNQVIGCTLIGPGKGGSTVGLLVGGQNVGFSAIQSTFAMNDISGFGTGLQFGNNSFIDTFINNHIHDNGTQLNVPASIVQFGENITFLGGHFAGGMPFSNSCVNIQKAGSLHFIGVSFNQCGLMLSAPANAVIDFISDHFENSVGADSGGYITIGASVNLIKVNFNGGDFYEGPPGGLIAFIEDMSTVNNNGNSFSILGTQFLPHEPIPIIKFTGSAVCCQQASIRDFMPGRNVSSPFSGTWYGTIFEYAGTITTSGVAAIGGLNQRGADNFAGVSTCSSHTKAISLPRKYASQPVILVFDETTNGGASLSAKSTSGFTVSCTGASDIFDWQVIGNPK